MLRRFRNCRFIIIIIIIMVISKSQNAFLRTRLCVCTKFGERAFSHAGFSAWNELPEDIRAIPHQSDVRGQLRLITRADSVGRRG